MTHETTCYVAAWPSLCEDCGQDIARYALQREDLNAFMVYCPHRYTLALVYAGQIEGRRGIVRWDVQAPLTHGEAIDAMNKMAPHAARMENLDKPRLQ